MYNEYRAPIGKNLLNTRTFSYGSIIIIMADILNELFAIPSAEAAEVSNNYREEESQLRETHKEEFEGLTPEEADALYNQLVEELRNTYTQALLDEGYVLGEDIEVVIHE